MKKLYKAFYDGEQVCISTNTCFTNSEIDSAIERGWRYNETQAILLKENEILDRIDRQQKLYNIFHEAYLKYIRKVNNA